MAGERLNLELEQIWDVGIGETGSKLEKEFTSWDGNCGTTEELHQQGANSQAMETWAEACKQALSERAKFDPVYRRMAEQRAELKSFQAAAKGRRKALVNEANRIQ